MEGLAITSIPACRKPGSGFKIFSGDAVVKGLCKHASLVSSSAAEGELTVELAIAVEK